VPVIQLRIDSGSRAATEFDFWCNRGVRRGHDRGCRRRRYYDGMVRCSRIDDLTSTYKYLDRPFVVRFYDARDLLMYDIYIYISYSCSFEDGKVIMDWFLRSIQTMTWRSVEGVSSGLWCWLDIQDDDRFNLNLDRSSFVRLSSSHWPFCENIHTYINVWFMNHIISRLSMYQMKRQSFEMARTHVERYTFSKIQRSNMSLNRSSIVNVSHKYGTYSRIWFIINYMNVSSFWRQCRGPYAVTEYSFVKLIYINIYIYIYGLSLIIWMSHTFDDNVVVHTLSLNIRLSSWFKYIYMYI
jgi:hypothetical protein